MSLALGEDGEMTGVPTEGGVVSAGGARTMSGALRTRRDAITRYMESRVFSMALP